MTAPAPANATERARRVQRIFDGALDLEGAPRDAYLAEACGGDTALRAEVEGLIASLGRAHTRDLLPPLVPAAAPPPSPSLTGLRIHNYEVDAVIGAGGMAEVYAAHHLVFPRKAALKVLQTQFSGNAEIVQRFINEARAANAIAHPNIIEVIDAGRLADSGAPYILMEYLEGESLGARLRAGGLPLGEAVRIFLQTAEAVSAAHDKGIIHRDLKPENIFLVSRPDAPPAVKVLDFGIAKLRSDVAGTLATQTQVGMIMGTPQYMSPEHCRDASGVDQRTDVYSLGVILFEMVCGRPPFQSATGFADLVYQHVAVAPPSPRSLAASLPPAVEDVILKCLAKAPDDRYASVRDLIDGLRAATAAIGQDLTAVAVRAPSPPRVAATAGRQPARRRGRGVGLVVGVVFLVAVVVGAAFALRGPSAPTARVEVPPVAATPPAPPIPAPTTAAVPTPSPAIETEPVTRAVTTKPKPKRAAAAPVGAPTPRTDLPAGLGQNPY